MAEHLTDNRFIRDYELDTMNEHTSKFNGRRARKYSCAKVNKFTVTQEDLNKEINEGSQITRGRLKTTGRIIMSRPEFIKYELGSTPILNRGATLVCMRKCNQNPKLDNTWVYDDFFEGFREDNLYLRMNKCPRDVAYKENFAKLVVKYELRASTLFNHMLDLVMRRVLYNPKYHWKVILSALNGYDAGLSEILSSIFVKMFEEVKFLRRRNYWQDVQFFVCKNYRIFLRSLLPVSKIEQDVWKNFKVFEMPVVAQGLFDKFHKTIISTLVGFNGNGAFLLEVANDITTVMKQVTDWILNAMGIDTNSTTKFVRFIKIFCVITVGGLVIQGGYFSVKLVWSLMVGLVKALTGSVVLCMDTLHVEDSEAQGDSQALTTLLNFGALAAVGSKMPLSAKLSAARLGAPLVEMVWENLKPFLNFCSRTVLGYDHFIGNEEVPALRTFIEDMINLLATPDIHKRCVLDSNLMRKVQELYGKSIEMRKVLLKTECYDGPARTQIAIQIARLDVLYASTLSTSSLVTDRPVPVFVYLSGAPGQGKSTMLDLLASGVHAFVMAAKKKDKQLEKVLKDNVHFQSEYQPYNKYARVLTSDYWEGYMGQWMVQYNEIFSHKTPLENAPTAMELLTAIESCSYSLDMAFGDKGKNFFTSNFVIATSNRDQFNNIGLATPDAFVRRIHCPITVERGQTLLADMSNLNLAWNLTLTTWPKHYDAQQLGVLPGLWELDGLSKKESGKQFGIIDLIEVIGKEMVSRYTSSSINQQASKVNWESLFSKAQGLSSSSSSSSEDEDEPQGWMPYLSTKFKDMFYPVKSSMSDDCDNGFVDCASEAAGTLLNYRQAFLYSESLSNKKKFKIADHLNACPNIDKIVRHYFDKPRKWYKTLRKNGFGSSDFGFVQGVDVFNRAKWGKSGDGQTHISYGSTEGFCIWTNIEPSEQISLNTVNTMYHTWFARSLRFLCTMSEMNLYLICVGVLLVGSVVSALGLSKMYKKMFVKKDEEAQEFIKIEKIAWAQSPKKEQLAMHSRYKIAPKIIQTSEAQSCVEVELVMRCNNILGNLRWARIEGKRRLWTLVLFGCPTILTLPLHSWYHAENPHTIEIQDNNGNQSTFFNRSQFTVEIPSNRDLVFLHFKEGVLPMSGIKTIYNSMPSAPLENVENPVRIMRMFDEKKQTYANVFTVCKSIKYENASRNNIFTDAIKVMMTGYYVLEGGKGASGMCSSPVITKDSRYQNTPILGVHIGRYGEDSIVAPLFKQDFMSCGDELGTKVISTAQGFDFDKLFNVDVISSDVPEGTAPYFTPKFPSYMMGRTELKKSILYDFLPEAQVAPALLTRKGDVDPLAKAYTKYAEHKGKPVNEWSASLMDKNFNYIKMFNRRPVDYKELTFEEALFGDRDTDDTIDGLELNTSSGYPYVCKGEKPKRRDWVKTPETIAQLKGEVLKLRTQLENGIYGPQIVIDQLKDELRSLDRVAEGKTRLFCVGSVVDCILTKMVLGGYLSSQKKHLFYSGACIGTNPHDISWACLYERIEKWPESKRERWFGGDARGYDYGILRWEIEFAYTYLRKTLPVSHSNVKFWTLIKGLLYRVATTVHITRDKAYICERRNSSGNWLTAWLNSFIKFTRIMACFLKRKPATEHYEEYDNMPITLMVYGDDNIGSVRKGIDWFDNMTLAEDMMTLFDCQFTDPLKGIIKDRFLELPSQVFLARRFVVLGHHIVKAPLAIESIFGMLYYVRGDSKSDQVARVKQNVMTAMQELSHYTKEEQITYTAIIQAACEKAGLAWDFDPPSKWELVRSERSTDTFYYIH